ncbi:PREDICTED: galactose-specific lectin nattectin-like [Branchiostoma belcheri]|uniref:Galactose-specific lectin nattectin-like n=1 Tax=Branchiostoma belcheri TaxID=7741 RepID=A0A6P4ZS18_BRABE|nr:PREDICTED: galactose-specific lectin nattectin-like [Branchiostoma belcheri]
MPNPAEEPGEDGDDGLAYHSATLRDFEGPFKTGPAPHGAARGPDEPVNRNVRAVVGSQGWDLPASCPTNGQLSLPNGKRYVAPSDEQVDYATAQARCVAEGGTVALPLDSNEQAYLVFFKNCLDQNAQFWLGVSRPDGTWVDSQGSALGGFSAWAPGEPDDPSYPCSHLVFGAQSDSERRNKWADAACGDSFRYICETDSVDCNTQYRHVEAGESFTWFNTETQKDLLDLLDLTFI